MKFKYWIAKIEENIARDVRNDKDLKARDWYPVHFWEKDVLNDLDECTSAILELVEYQREEILDNMIENGSELESSYYGGNPKL